MHEGYVRALLQKVHSGEADVETALSMLKNLPFEDLGDVKIDHHRALRTGRAEVIYCAGKTLLQVTAIVESMLSAGTNNIIGTRAELGAFEAVKQIAPDAVYYDVAKIISIKRDDLTRGIGEILVLTGGTADIPVAEEAAVTAELLGHQVNRIYDVGVAGIHRLLAYKEQMNKANVIIAVAGMEGALPSVVAGLIERPIIAVPTSVGYGASFGGLSALLTMLNSCASGIAVVNIDNGFGAGVLAAQINEKPKEAK